MGLVPLDRFWLKKKEKKEEKKEEKKKKKKKLGQNCFSKYIARICNRNLNFLVHPI